ncbi:HNH endonuclease [Aureimonas altamirensis]|uniref:HNH endonuclease signature motif containing protein n=1 Tax=Aureimonas altamirensis TaxID=370622 RepID=UPI00203739C2|nr:HNH endonuclease signature motif containing protein [Aureimonas altamirensis]MCM2503897.1 HNH endonuclease [Aureimonas altamirensis]
MNKLENKNDITQAELNELLTYNPTTGEFHWKQTSPARSKKGNVAGSVDAKGYRVIAIRGHSYYAHRLAWRMVTGNWPTDCIDHINRIRDDNAWANLREATRAENLRNRSLYKNNKSGYKGVYRYAEGSFGASVNLDGKRYFLGLFPTAEAAYAAYLGAARVYHGEFNVGAAAL